MSFLNANAYWSSVLGNQVVYCGFREPGAPVQPSYEDHHIAIEDSVNKRLEELTSFSPEACSLLFASVAGVLLQKYTQRDTVWTSTITDNHRHELRLLPLKMDFTRADQTFKGLINQISDFYTVSLVYGDFSVEAFTRKVFPEHNSPLFFDSCCFLADTEDFDNVVATVMEKQVDLIFALTIRDRKVALKLVYNRNYLDSDWVHTISQQFVNILRYLVVDPDAIIRKLNIISPEERQKILTDFNNTDHEVPLRQPIHTILSERAKVSGNDIALRWRSGIVTYGELDNNSNQLANFLIGKLKVDVEDRVGVLMDRSPEMITAIFGSVKAGCSYVPLDPNHPEERLRQIMEDAGIKCVISEKKYLRSLNRLLWNASTLESYLCLDSEEIETEVEQSTTLGSAVVWNQIAQSEGELTEIKGGGWYSSFTGKPFSREEMAEFSGNAVMKLAPYLTSNTKVLEIGCGTGLTMYEIAPLVGEYHALDLSSEMLKKHEAIIIRQGFRNIRLYCLAADALDQLNTMDFDVVVMNSVIHCFNGHNYLNHVLKQVMRKVKDRSIIFLGDLLDLNLKDQFLNDLLEFKLRGQASDTRTKTDWSNDLFLSREYLSCLPAFIAGIDSVDISLKHHKLPNELTKFRFDALISVDKKKEIAGAVPFKNQFDRSDVTVFPVTAPNRNVAANNLAYIIYTSGTTGTPKGVMIEHGSLNNRIYWMQQKYPLKRGDTLLFKTPFTFDVSVWEIFWWVVAGGELCILDSGREKDPRTVVAEIARNNVSIVHFVPSMLDTFLSFMIENGIGASTMRSLRQIFTSGEALTPAHVLKCDKIFGRTNVKLSNLYGPTEATIDVSYFDVELSIRHRCIPIGKPIYNTNLYVLDEDGDLQTIGVPGQLCIAGVALSRGYINKQLLTSQKFVAGRFDRHYVLYLTGDLARWMPDGNIEYLGRTDRQAKVRGMRMETDEVSLYLSKCPHVKQAVAVVKPFGGSNTLFGYYVADLELSPEDIRQYLSLYLPAYMVPTFLMAIDSLPINANGKLDVAKLPEQVSVTAPINVATTDEEKIIAGLFAKVLEREEQSIDIDTSFFEYGGHSLLAVALTFELEKKLSVYMVIDDVFQYPTVRKLSAVVNQHHDSGECIPNAPRRPFFPLSPSQSRMFLQQQLDLNSTAYNLPQAFIIEGSLDIGKLTDSFLALTRRHEALRTFFDIHSDMPVQRTEERVDIEVIHIPYNYDGQVLIEDFIKPFNLAKAPLLRVGISRTPEGKHLLIVDKHHIISDGISDQILSRDLVDLYNGKALYPPELQYKDYTEWLSNSKLQQLKLERQKEFWQQELKDEPPVVTLPYDFVRPATKTFDGDRVSFKIDDPSTIRKLDELAAGEEATRYMVLLSVFVLFLAKLSNQRDIIHGIAVSGRDHRQLSDIVGAFVNTLSLRHQVDTSVSFRVLVQRVKTRLLKALQNQDIPFESVVNQLNVRSDLSRNPLFDVMFLYMEETEIPLGNFAGLSVTTSDFRTHTSKFDLTLDVYRRKNSIELDFEYDTTLFKRTTIDRLRNYFRTLIDNACHDPNALLKDLTVIPEVELVLLTKKINDTKKAYPDICVHNMFEMAARRFSSDVAIECGGRKMTYQQVNAAATHIAFELRSKGVAAGDVVALIHKRSIMLLPAILGILKSGGCLLPIDPAFPKERIDYVLLDSRAQIALADEIVALPGGIACIEVSEGLGRHRNDNLIDVSRPSDLCYMLYTSGSTGYPKGVMVTHKNVVNFFTGICSEITLTERRKALCLTTISFDIFILESLLPLVKGMQVVLATESDQLDVDRLCKLIVASKVDVVQMTPSRLRTLVEQDPTLRCLQDLEYLLVGGEKLPKELSVKVMASYRGRFFNMYGPTETTIWSTMKEIIETGDTEIGRPLANTSVFVLDDDLKLLPLGVEGELFIGGDGVTSGYWNLPEVTQSKFLDNPFNPSERLYRTGDIVKWTQHGCLQFVTRKDTQVKVNGYRIELGEIERCLERIDGVTTAVAQIHEYNGHAQLVGYYVSNADLGEELIEDTLAKTLPAYMLPSRYVRLSQMPRTPNGKLDRRALAISDRELSEYYSAPVTNIEIGLAEIFSEIFKIDRNLIGREHSFINLGGNSMMAMVMVNRIKSRFGVEISLRNAFELKYLHRIAGLVSDRQRISTEMIEGQDQSRSQLVV
jgi:fengycin family lipopeptide synthetase D